MNSYIIYYRMKSKKMKQTIYAKNEKEAEAILKDQLVIDKISVIMNKKDIHKAKSIFNSILNMFNNL